MVWNQETLLHYFWIAQNLIRGVYFPCLSPKNFQVGGEAFKEGENMPVKKEKQEKTEKKREENFKKCKENANREEKT